VDLDDASAPEETDEGAAPQDAEAEQTTAPGGQ